MPKNPFAKLKRTPRSESRTRLSKFLAQPLRLEEHGPPRTFNQLLLVTCLFVAAFVVWTTVTEIHETAIAPGQVRTQDSVGVVQHLEGGIISDIMVREGDKVRKGQPLFRLAGRGTLSDLGALRAREVALSLETERLRAFVEERKPDFSIGKDHPDLVRDQASILRLQRKAKRSKQQVLESRIQQRRQELGTLRGRLKNLERRFKLTKEAVEMRRELVAKGLVSRLLYLESEQAFAKAEGDITDVKGQIRLARESLHEAETNLIELNATTYNTAIEEMGRVRNELAQVTEAMKKSSDRAERLVVTAPEAGIVKGLIARSRGSVVGPSDNRPRKRQSGGRGQDFSPRYRLRAGGPGRQGQDHHLSRGAIRLHRRQGHEGLRLHLRRRARRALLQGDHRAGPGLCGTGRGAPPHPARHGRQCRCGDRFQDPVDLPAAADLPLHRRLVRRTLSRVFHGAPHAAVAGLSRGANAPLIKTARMRP